MWRSRDSNSRGTGLSLLLVSGVLLAVSFLTGNSAFEIVAIISFVTGVFLLASGAEATVRLIPSAEANIGPLLALSGELRSRGLNGKAVFVPQEDGGTLMQFGENSGDGHPAKLVPVGSGLVKSYERVLGSLKEADMGYIKTWLPRVLVKGLGLTEGAKIQFEDTGAAKAIFNRPFVRPLCVREDFNEKVCRVFGCPLVSSIGELLASSTGKEVLYKGCEYDRLTETATAAFKTKGDG
jgi:hypothetical protein